MANRWQNQFTQSIDAERTIVDGYGQITDSIGTVSFTPAAGVASFVHNSTGFYTITLQDAYNLVLSAPAPTFVMTSGIISATGVWTVLDPLNKTFSFKVINTSGSVVELPPQAGIYFTLFLKNSGLPRGK